MFVSFQLLANMSFTTIPKSYQTKMHPIDLITRAVSHAEFKTPNISAATLEMLGEMRRDLIFVNYDHSVDVEDKMEKLDAAINEYINTPYEDEDEDTDKPVDVEAVLDDDIDEDVVDDEEIDEETVDEEDDPLEEEEDDAEEEDLDDDIIDEDEDDLIDEDEEDEDETVDEGDDEDGGEPEENKPV